MRKFLIISLAICLVGISAMAQEIDDGKFVEEGLKFEVTSHNPKTVKVIANDYKGLSFTIPATVSYLGNDYAVTAIGENAFAGVGSQSNPAVLLLPADWEGTKPEATATLWYGGYFVDCRTTTIAAVKAESDEAENSIEEAATGFVDIEDVKQAKADANSALTNAQATADNTISAAVDMIAIKNAKDAAISAIHMATAEALVAIQAAIASFKEGTIAEIKNVATHNKNSILEYAVAHQVKETARNEIDNAVAEAEASINNADSEEQVNDAKNDALNKINQQLANVQNYYNQLQAAIAEIKVAANDAKEEIDGLGVDDNAKNDAKAEIDNIAHTAEQTINEATSKDAIDNAKTQAIAKIQDVVLTTKNMWVTVRENMTVGTYGTLCWKYNLTAIDGAKLYAIAGIENGRIILEEVKVEETEAGAAYLICATDTRLRVKNGDQYTDTPLAAAERNGLQGTFEEIKDGAVGAAGNILEGNYIIYQKEWRKCGSDIRLESNHAYLVMTNVPGY